MKTYGQEEFEIIRAVRQFRSAKGRIPTPAEVLGIFKALGYRRT
jgi:hypothetical protein